MASSTLVIYLAFELGAEEIGLGISFILAAPQLVGVLRLVAPALIGRVANRKHFCVTAFFLSAVGLMVLPAIALPGHLPSPTYSLIALVVLWCVYHLLQYLGTVALWSWLADLVPMRIRGGFIGRRQRWMVAGQALAMLNTGLCVWGWGYAYPRTPIWIAYVILASIGACFMIAALVPLLLIPKITLSKTVQSGATVKAMLAPLFDSTYLRLVAFGCWFSFFNGVTQSPQRLFQLKILGVSLFVMLMLKTGMRIGQLSISPWLGRLADRRGNRQIMIVSLLLVAQGPLFYLFSSPAHPWWFVGAWVVWIAYAGLNIGLPNLMLKLSPERSNTPYIASYFAIVGVCYAVSTLIGGALLDRFDGETFELFDGTLRFDYYHISFLFGWITRSLGVLVLLFVVKERRTISVRPASS